MKKKTRAYRAPYTGAPWYAQHFELLYHRVRARHAAPPPEVVEQELAEIFEEGDRRRVERNADAQATTDPVSTAAGRRTRKEKHRLCALISRPFIGIPAVHTGVATAAHTEVETTGTRPAAAIPASDWKEKQWLSDLIGRPLLLPAVHTEVQTSGTRPAAAIPASDGKEKQWLSDLIGRPLVLPAVLTGSVAAMLAVGWGDYMPR
ncbi:hypothetical protein ABZX90_08425 [Streptomyces sp. NPDC002935]|uniref:hypothetical protein n=1 Tax=Streptomyces sp. NPDC002935 TaxID=3154545 RepID=UPI0033B2F70B